jgi:hypothetical protein
MLIRLFAVLGSTAVALVLASGASSRQTACTAGVKTVAGVTYRTFCGPAHATLKAGGKAYAFRGGACTISGGYFTINIGTITLPPGKPKYTYFGITVFGKRDGVYRNSAVSWQVRGQKNSLILSTVTVSGGRLRGTFAGKLLFGGGPASGSFGCH